MTKILVRRGPAASVPPSDVVVGELLYLTDRQELWVGTAEGTATKAAQLVVGPHDQLLYAKLPANRHFIPIGIVADWQRTAEPTPKPAPPPVAWWRRWLNNLFG